MPGIDSFIQSFLGLRQLQLEKQRIAQQADQADAASKLQAMAQARELLQQTENPAEQTGLVKFFSQRYGIPEDALHPWASALQPTESTVQVAAARRGRAAMDKTTGGKTDQAAANFVLGRTTEKDIAAGNFLADLLHRAVPSDQLGQAFATHLATGGGTGDLASQNLLASVLGQANPNDPNLVKGAAYKMLTGGTPADASLSAGLDQISPLLRAQLASGITPTAAQAANIAQGWKGLGLQSRGLDIQEANDIWGRAIQEAGLAADNMRAEAALKAAAGKGGTTPAQLTSTLNSYRSLLSQISTTKAKRTLTPDEKKQYADALNAHRKLLFRSGLISDSTLITPDQMDNPSFLSRIFGGGQ